METSPTTGASKSARRHFYVSELTWITCQKISTNGAKSIRSSSKTEFGKYNRNGRTLKWGSAPSTLISMVSLRIRKSQLKTTLSSGSIITLPKSGIGGMRGSRPYVLRKRKGCQNCPLFRQLTSAVVIFAKWGAIPVFSPKRKKNSLLRRSNIRKLASLKPNYPAKPKNWLGNCRRLREGPSPKISLNWECRCPRVSTPLTSNDRSQSWRRRLTSSRMSISRLRRKASNPRNPSRLAIMKWRMRKSCWT